MIFLVHKPNPFVPVGRFVRRFSDGYEEFIPGSWNGRLIENGYQGLVWPHATLAPFLMRVQERGLDMGSARMDRRRAEENAPQDQQAVMEEEAVTEMCDELHERKHWPTGLKEDLK